MFKYAGNLRRNLRTIFIFVWILFEASPCFATASSEAIDVTTLGEYLPITHAKYLRIEKDKFPDETIIATSQSEFLDIPRGATFLQGSSDNTWIKFSLHNPTAEASQLLLAFHLSGFAHAKLFSFDGQKLVEKQVTGYREPPDVRPVHSFESIFKLNTPARSTRNIFIKIDAISKVDMHPKLYLPGELEKKLVVESLFMGLYYGVALALLFYNLFLFIAIRDISYLYYVCYVFFISASILTLDGTADYYLANPFFHWWEHINHLAYTGVFFALAFAREFLNTRKNLPRLDKIIVFLGGVCVAGLVASFIFKTHMPLIIIDLTIASSAIILMSIGTFAFFKGVRAARFYLMSWLVLVVSLFTWLIYSYGFLGRSPLLIHSMHIGASLEMIFLSLALADRIKAIDAERQRAEGREKESKAVVQTMQMIAHDIRKPFSLLTMMLDELQSRDIPAKVKAVTMKFDSEVRKAIAIASGQMTDVLELGRKSRPVSAAVETREIIQSAIKDLCVNRPGAEVEFKYNLNITHCMEVDESKVYRVFVNILENAMHALDERGVIWINAKEDLVENVPRIVIEIGNFGAVIPAEKLDTIFDIFYTNKSSGTGLGLAIARRVVESHGGQIFCQSSKLDGTRFVFDLPISTQASNSSVDLPVSSIEVRRALAFVEPADDWRAIEKLNEWEDSLQRQILKYQVEGEKVHILILDDERLYVEAIRSQIASLQYLTSAFEIQIAHTSKAALKIVQDSNPGIIICDVDLGFGSEDGFEFVKKLRDAGSLAEICIHSNRSRSQSFRDALDAGADSFLPKPMSKNQLLSLLLNGIRRREGSSKINSVGQVRPLVAFVDDNAYVRQSWLMQMKDADLISFAGPEEFWKYVQEPGSKPFELILTDYYFGETDQTGFDFAASLDGKMSCPVIITSDADLSQIKWTENVVGVIDKHPRLISDLLRKFKISTRTEIS